MNYHKKTIWHFKARAHIKKCKRLQTEIVIAVERASFIELRFDDLQKHVVNLTKNTTKEQERMLAKICELEFSNKGFSKSNVSCKKDLTETKLKVHSLQTKLVKIVKINKLKLKS